MSAPASESRVLHPAPYVVLVGMDFSKPADDALRKALELCAAHECAELHVVSVVPHDPVQGGRAVFRESWFVAETSALDGVRVSLHARIRDALARFASRTATTPTWRVVPHVLLDAPDRGLARLAREVAADVVVLGARGQGQTTSELGSVAAATLRTVRCSVVLTQLARLPETNSQ